MVSSVSFGGAHSLDFYTAPRPVTLPPGTTVTSSQLCPLDLAKRKLLGYGRRQ